MNRLLAILGLMSCSTAALSADVLLNYSLQPVFTEYNQDSYINLSKEVIPQPDLVSKQIVELSVTSDQLSMTATARQTVADGNETDSDLVVKELLYSTTVADFDISLGRKISSWGVGLAYRPLDVVQREDLLSSAQETLKGVNQIAIEHYGETDSLGFTIINPGEDKTKTDATQPAVIARYTNTGENSDWQALLRYSDEHSTQAGAGISYIATDALELHVSALYSTRYHRRQHALAGQSATLLAMTDPWQDTGYNNGVNWLVGGNYSWAAKHNIMFEYWHDDMALSKAQWQDQIDLMNSQHAMLDTATPQNAVQGNLAWSAEAFSNEHLIQDNLFLRYQYQGDTMIPRASLLYSPADASTMMSAQIMFDRYQVKYNVGMRFYNGDEDSVYGQLPLSTQLYFTVYGNY